MERGELREERQKMILDFLTQGADEMAVHCVPLYLLPQEIEHVCLLII